MNAIKKGFFSIFLSLSLIFLLNFVVIAQEEINSSPAIILGEYFIAQPEGEPQQGFYDGDQLKINIMPHSTLYFPLENAGRAENLSGYRAVAIWNKGEEYIYTTKIEYKQMFDESGENSLGYKYVVSVVFLETADSKPVTLQGKIKVATRRNENVPTVNLTINLNSTTQNNENVIFSSKESLLASFEQYKGNAVIKFGNAAEFEFDTTGQGGVNIGFSTVPISDFAQRYPKENLRYVYWSGKPFFNWQGKLKIWGAESDYLYEIKDNQIVLVEDSYDSWEGAFVIETRRLEGYILAENLLDLQAAIQPLENPPTGVLEKFLPK